MTINITTPVVKTSNPKEVCQAPPAGAPPQDFVSYLRQNGITTPEQAYEALNKFYAEIDIGQKMAQLIGIFEQLHNSNTPEDKALLNITLLPMIMKVQNLNTMMQMWIEQIFFNNEQDDGSSS